MTSPNADAPGRPGPFSWRALAVYLLMLAAAIGIFFLVQSYGEELGDPASATAAKAGPPAEKSDALLHVLITLAAVILAGRTLGRVFQHLGQPPVIGEVVAGILLGPSLLGRVSPEAARFLLPPTVAPYLAIVAQLGVILYMFLIGLELDAGRLRSQAHSTIAISHAGIVFPFVLGSVLALPLYTDLAPAGISFTSFALFMGVALSVTAFPVLARILSDRGLTRTDLGRLALACAAADDATAWCLLALAVGVARAQLDQAVLVFVWLLVYVAVMLLLVRPLARRFTLAYPEEDKVDRGAIAIVLLALLGSAAATEAIGVHAIFGAFFLGAVIPHDSALTRAFNRKLEDIVVVLLLPAFFAYTGMRTQIGLLTDFEDWLACALIIAVATLGKFGGTFVAARLTGQDWRMSAALGTLMNTRGLMELIVLNIGLDLGIISPRLFAMMVIMALVTTLLTAPVLARLSDASQKRAA